MVDFKNAWSDIMQLLTGVRMDCPFSENEAEKRLRAVANYLLLVIEDLIEEEIEESAFETGRFTERH